MNLPVLDFLQNQLAGKPAEATHMRYPTAISETLGIRIVAVASDWTVMRLARIIQHA